MNKKFAEIVLSSLLHDIGKFFQRTGLPHSIDSSQYDIFCPYNHRKNYFTHKHSLWTETFFQKYKEYIPREIFNISNIYAAKHHRPENTGELLIHEADCLSAGMDRDKTKDEEIKEDDIRHFRKSRLLNIFNEISYDNKSDVKKNYLELRPLSIKADDIYESLFPKYPENLSPPFGEMLDNEYRTKLWEDFEDEFKLLPKSNTGSFLFSLDYLLQKYTSSIPSSTVDLPDVSLYDHCRTTSALAISIYDFLEGNLTKESVINRSDKKFLLVCGDISGIQNFIYTIASKRAAKSLRGRSFYLSLLSVAIARFFLRKLGYPLTNILYSGGGKFFIVVANKLSNKNKIDNLNREINEKLLEKYTGRINFNLGKSEFSGNELMQGNFSDIMGRTIRDLNIQRKKLYHYLSYDKIFKPFEDGGEKNTCDVCFKETSEEKDEEGQRVCQECKKMEKLGEKLRKAKAIFEIFEPTDKVIREFKDKNFYFEECKTLFFALKDTKPGFLEGRFVNRYVINDTSFLDNSSGSSTNGFGFIFTGGQDFSVDVEGKPVDFETLAKPSVQFNEKGISRLGVLRMDVDNLGKIFTSGFPNRRRTISRFASLSRRLKLFFGGFISHLVKKEKFKGRVHIIYSGGDDLFAVGYWDKIARFAEEISQHFALYVKNPLVHLSAGIALVRPKFPIHKGAQLSGIAEGESKKYCLKKLRCNIEKEAITFLGKTVSWHDFTICKRLADKLVELIEQGKQTEEGRKKMNKGFISKLYLLSLIYKQSKKNLYDPKSGMTDQELERILRFQRWVWLQAYYIDRVKRKNEIFVDDISQIRDAIIKNEYDGEQTREVMMDIIDLPIRWAELLMRKEESSSDIR